MSEIEYDLYERIDLSELGNDGETCGLYHDQVEAILNPDHADVRGDWQAWRLRAYRDGQQLSGSTIILVYNHQLARAGVCEGGMTLWGNAANLNDALAQYEIGALTGENLWE